MDQVPNSAEKFAKEAAGSWRDLNWGCFIWYNEPDDADNWAIWNFSSRDDDIAHESNAEVIHDELDEFCGYIDDGDDAEWMSASHWAAGYVQGIAFRCLDSEDNPTPVCKKVHELMLALQSYPLLDEDDYCRREYEARLESISDGLHYTLIDSLYSVSDFPELCEKIFRWLWNHDQYAFHSDYVNEKSVDEAFVSLWESGELGALDWDMLGDEWQNKIVDYDTYQEEGQVWYLKLDRLLIAGAIDPDTLPYDWDLSVMAVNWTNKKQEEAGQLQLTQVK